MFTLCLTVQERTAAQKKLNVKANDKECSEYNGKQLNLHSTTYIEVSDQQYMLKTNL